jgi:hypothetical protein
VGIYLFFGGSGTGTDERVGPTDDSSEKVKGWRHKLQKSFLTKDKPITADVSR